jgi:hypothetical protein
MSVPPRLLRGSGQVFRNHYLSRKSLLVLLYSHIVSAISNVVDFMVSTSQLDFILRFLAMAELKRASFCSFGLPKT